MYLKRLLAVCSIAATLFTATACGKNDPSAPQVARLYDSQVRKLRKTEPVNTLVAFDSKYTPTQVVSSTDGVFLMVWYCEAPRCNGVDIKDRVEGNARPGFRFELKSKPKMTESFEFKDNRFAVLFWATNDPNHYVPCTTNDPTFLTTDGLKTAKFVAETLAANNWAGSKIGEYEWHCN